jgi:hypothetical protein
MKKPPWVDKAVIHQVPIAIQFTFRVPEPEDPAIQTWKLAWIHCRFSAPQYRWRLGCQHTTQ